MIPQIESFDAIQFLKDIFERVSNKMAFDQKRQMRFLVNFERMLRKLNPTKAINQMALISDGIELRVCNDILASLQEGGSISDGMSKWFDPIVTQGIKIGEKKNGLIDSVRTSIKANEVGTSKLFSEFSVVIYPFVILLSACIVCTAVGERLIKIIQDKISKMPSIPLEIKVIQSVTEFIQIWMWPSIFVAITLVFFIVNYLNKSTSDFRFSLDRRPIFYEFRQLKAIFFLRMYSMLKKYNLTDMDVLSTISNAQNNFYLSWHIGAIKDSIQEGISLSDAIDTGLINSRDVLTLKVLADADNGELCEAIDNTVEGLVENVKERFKRIASIVRYTIFITAAFIMSQLLIFIFTVDQYFKV